MPKDEKNSNNTNRPEIRSPGIVTQILRQFTILLAALFFVGLLVFGTATLHMRANAEKAPVPHPPITVETTRIVQKTGFVERSYYVGRLEPARQTALSFERSGLVTNVERDESDTVRKGEIVAVLDTDQLLVRRSQLEARQRELEARRKFALSTKSRRVKLKTQGWSTGERLDAALANVDELAASLDQVKAQIKAIDIDLRKSKLVAPFDGVIAERSIDEGAVVSAGTPIVQLLEAAHRQARIGLPPEKANKLIEGRDYVLKARDQRLTGKLVARRPDLQSGTRTITTLFDVKGAEKISFGELVTLEFEAEVPEQGAWIPLTALKEGKRGLWTIFTVIENEGQNIIHSEAVEILHAKDQEVFVRGTFSEGDLVLSNGINRVTRGQRVALAKE